MSSSSFFGAGSPYLTHPLLTQERTAAEIDAVHAMVSLPQGPVLDVGCGFGRHSVELAKRDISVTGIDPSSAMIEAARDRARRAGVTVDFEQTEAAHFQTARAYELAICLFTTLGQRNATGIAPHDLSTEPEKAILRSIASALAADAPLILEVPDKARTLDALVTSEQLGPTAVERDFDEASSVISEQFQTGPERAYALAYRIFSEAEITALLTEHGFRISETRPRGLIEPPFTLNTFIAHKTD